MKVKILLLLLFISAVHAQEIADYKARIEITDMNFIEEVLLTILNAHETELKEITYPFTSGIENISVYGLSGKLDSSYTSKGDKSYITAYLKEPLLKGENYTVTYRFISPGEITKKENTYILSTTHSLLANVRNFRLTVVLPEGYGVAKEGVSPKPTEITSDMRRVILRWDYNQIPVELREFKVIVLYEKLAEREKPQQPINIYLFGGGLVIALAALRYAVNYLREEGISLADYFDRKRYVEGKIDILKEDEQAILKLVIENNGLDQREIQRKTGFSKTKVSKILSELERRGVIAKEQIGRRNKIFLTKKLKET